MREQDDLLARARDAVAMAREVGAADVFAGASRSREVSTTRRDGKIEKLTEATTRSLDLEVWVDGRYGVASTTDLRPDRLKAFAADLVAVTRALQADPDRQIADPALFAGRADVDLQLHDPAVGAITPEERAAYLERMAAGVEGKEAVVSATCSVSDTTSSYAAVSSNGFEGARTETALWLAAEVTLRGEGNKRPEAGTYGGARHRADAPDPEWVGEDALAQARARLGSVRGPTVLTTMVVDPRAASRLIRSLSSGTHGEAIHQRRSHWVGKLGQPVISPLLTITDEPHLPRGLASRLWDGEGLATRPMTLIEGGALRAYYLDTTYARKLKMAPTTGSGSNRVVALGERDRDGLVADAGTGILVTSWLGGNMNPATGDFSYGIRGHRIENGEVGEPIGETNITGNVLSLFASLRAVGNDPWPYSSIRCPTLAFDEVQFS